MIRWRAVGTELKNAWPATLVLGGLFIAATVAWLFSATGPDAVRYAGTILQIFGLGTVAVGLSQTRQLFGRPSIPARVKSWFGRLRAALRRPEPITVQASSGELFLHGESPRIIIGPAPNATVEQRVAVLEQNLARLRDEVDQHAQTMRQEIRQIEEKLAAEDQGLRSAVEANAKKIEESAIGGLHLEVVGICWLFFGIVGTSIPGEVALGIADLASIVGRLFHRG